MARVFARKSLSRGRVSRAFQLEKWKSVENSPEGRVMYLDLDASDHLILATDAACVPAGAGYDQLPLAGDVQNRSVELTLDRQGWRLRAVKEMAAGDKVELWFSEDVLAVIGMPFLTPANIKGRKNYACHECGVQFEQPNPLKIHLFLSCQHFTPQIFWKKFTKFCQEAAPLNLSTNRLVPKSRGDFRRPRSQENYAHDPEISNRCYSEPPFSAFRPYRDDTIDWIRRFHNPFNSMFLQPPRVCPVEKPAWEAERIHEISKSFDSVSIANPADVEAFATNWGKSNKGHLCIYCGKVYSRKYGLKIHIRTHTGYKPLQCKYCLRPFGDPSNLNKHVRLHSQSETPYSCQLCGKMLVRKRDLERHLRSRHGDESVILVRDSPSP